MENRELLAVVNDVWRTDFASARLLREGGSASYVLEGQCGKFFLKDISPAFRSTAKQSLSILNYLEQQDFPVPHIVRTASGALFCEREGQFLVLFAYLEGGEPCEGADLRKIGALVGRMHRLMEKYPGELIPRGKPFFIDRYIEIMKKKGYDAAQTERFSEYGKELWSRVNGLPRGFCHGDLYRGNILRIGEGKYVVLDFDTACHAFPIFDIVVYCSGIDYFRYQKDGFAKTMRYDDEFLKGYITEREISREELYALPDMMALYHYELQATIMEVYGLDCVDGAFFDAQFQWLMRWEKESRAWKAAF